MNIKCIYFVEGPCEKQLVEALKTSPEKLIPGKVKVFNPIQNILSNSQLLMIRPRSVVVFVYDTDVPDTVTVCALPVAYKARAVALFREAMQAASMMRCTSLVPFRCSGMRNLCLQICQYPSVLCC